VAIGRPLAIIRDYTGAADKAVNLVGCKSPHHQLPGRVVSMSDACGGNEACSARTSISARIRNNSALV
jgi:hypothetical protein